MTVEPTQADVEQFVRKQFSPGKRQSSIELESKPTHQRDFERELQNLSRLKLISHPNILELLCCYECDGDFNLIFPKAEGGNLRHIFDGRQRGILTTEDDLVLALPGLCSAVRAIHDFVHEDQDTSFRLTGFHHDLKPENILTEAGKLILADFGIAQLKDVTLTSETSWKAPHPYYGPPECYITEPGMEKPRVHRSSDIWSLGCIMAEIIAFMDNGPEGIETFRKNRTQRSLDLQLVTYRFHRFGKKEPGVSQFLATQQQSSSAVRQMLGRLVSKMLEIDPRDRPAASVVEARMQVITMSMICHDITVLYGAVTAMTGTFAVLIEQTRFDSWKDVCGIPPDDKDRSLRIPWSARNMFQDTLSSLHDIRRRLRLAQEANSLDSGSLQAMRQTNDFLIEHLPQEFQAQTQEYISSRLKNKGDPGDVTSDQQDPLPLVGRLASQQGSIDWVNLVTKVLSFPVGLLARLCATRVDPYTLAVGQAMSQKFQLGPAGQQNMKRALGKLDSFNSFGDVFSFGFSPQSFVRTLSRTDEGGSLLALCAALGECFQEDLVAEVLHSLAQSYKAPESLTPSTFEWLALTNACSGLLSATDFPVLAEQLMSMAPNNGKFSSNHLTPFENDGRGFPSNDDLANALLF